MTEPTPFGLNDLKLAVGVVKILRIPFGLVINRSDEGDEQVKNYAEEENISVLMEIPFDRRIAEAYSRGKILVEVMPELREKFRALYRDIAEMTEKRVPSQ
jgi:MinD superfamily P-loop ATPase